MRFRNIIVTSISLTVFNSILSIIYSYIHLLNIKINNLNNLDLLVYNNN